MNRDSTAQRAEDSICAPGRRPFVLAATILASAMAFIDGSVVTIALPVIRAELGASLTQMLWILNAYTLMLAALLMVGGAAGDRLGRRRLFLVGTIVFALASLICALAPTPTVLIAGRAVQGIGAALLVPQSLAIISSSYPSHERGRAIGLWAGASALTTALGPAVGGVLMDLFGWRAVFWINPPLALIVIVLTLRLIPKTQDSDLHGRLDWGGALVVMLACGLLTLGLTLLTETQADAGLSRILILMGLVGLVAFFWLERRVPYPLAPPVLFRNRSFTGTNLMTLLLYGALSGTMFLVPIELIERRGLSPTEVGLAMMPFGLIIGMLSGPAGKLSDRIGPRALLVTGSLVVALGIAGLAPMLDSFWWGVELPICTMALGMAMVVSPLTTAVMNSVPSSRVGAASGINNTASRLAGLFAIAAAGAIAARLFQASQTMEGAQFGLFPSPGSQRYQAIEQAFHVAYAGSLLTLALSALAAAVIAWLMVRPEPSESSDRRVQQ